MSFQKIIDPGITSMLNSFDDYVFLLDNNGVIVFANKAAHERLGYLTDELECLNVLEVHPVDQRVQAGIIVQNMLLGTESVCPIPLLTKSGGKVPVETKVSKIDLNGESYILGISRDTTEWIETNLQLTASEEKFKKSFELSTRMMAISEFESGKYIDVNEMFTTVTGYAKDEAIGKTSVELQLFTPKLRKHLIEHLLRYNSMKGEELDLLLVRHNKTIHVSFDATLFTLNDKKYLITIADDITAKKKNELDLAQSEKQLQLVIDGSNDGFWDWNIGSGSVEFSRRWAEIMGYLPDEIEYNLEFWDKSVHPDDKGYVYAEIDRHFQGKTDRYSSEHRVRCKDGSYVWILDRGRIVEWDNAGRPLRMVGTHSDINEKKIADQKLKYRESFERLVNEISSRLINIPCAEIDNQLEFLLREIGNFIGVDRSYIFLYDDTEAVMSNTHEWCKSGIEPQKENLQAIPCAMLPWWMEQMRLQQLINMPDVDSMPDEASAEKQILKDQDIQSVIIVPLVNQQKNTGFVGFDAVETRRDWDTDTELMLQNAAITIVNALQRKKNETSIEIYKNQLEALVAERTRALEESKNKLNHTLWELAKQNEELIKFKTIADKANYPIIILSSQELIIYSNKKFSEITGWVDRNPHHHNFINDFVDQGGSNFADFATLLRERGEIVTLEIMIRNLSGTLIPALVNATAIYDSKGGFLFFLLSFSDLTERKKSEQALQQSDKLRALGTLSGGIAHDFNNILQIVQVYTELIELQHKGLPEIDSNIKEIYNACSRGKSLVKNILNFSRQEVNIMEPYRFDFLLKEILRIVKPLYPRSIEIKEKITPVGSVSCDPVQIQQILFNIFNNSMDSMEGKGTITLELRKLKVSERLTEHDTMLRITDTGKGMDQEVLDRIFDPFFTTKGVGEGTGLGLPTVLAVTKRHNALIKINSLPDKGTVVTILFISQQ